MHKSIAVVGIGCVFPDAMDVSEYWSNIIYGKDSIKEIPDNFWSLDDYYGKDSKKEDKSYSKNAGTVGDIPFNALEFGVMPKDLESISVEQIFALVVAKQALVDAGMYGKKAKEFNREKVGVILAAGLGKTAFSLNTRLQIPKFRRILRNSGVSEELTERVLTRIADSQLEWTENSNPGYLANVVAGRVASRFNLYGTNCTVDAACASSLAALKFAVDELENGDCDTVLTGAVNLDCSEFSFVSFCKTPAISKSDRIMPFSENADGMILGDGVGMVVLKLLEKAEQDGDRIYGVIKGMGSSGDGRSKGIFSPSIDGQVKAMERAYENANVNPSTVSLIEGHGTATKVGDKYELEALKKYFGTSNDKHDIGIGSVKSQIGHTRLAAGMASFIKTVLSVYHKTLPMTLHVDEPSKIIENTQFNVISKSKPWIVNKNNPVRRAGVSAFGFGGTNYHVVIEEYKGEQKEAYRLHNVCKSLVLGGTSKKDLIEQCNEIKTKLLNKEEIDYRSKKISHNEERIGLLFKNKEDAVEKLDKAINILSNNEKKVLKTSGIYYRAKGISEKSKIATLFIDNDCSYKDMLCDLAINYPEMRESFSKADNALINKGKLGISQIVYSLGENKSYVKDELSKSVNKLLISAVTMCGLYKILKTRGYRTNYFISSEMQKLMLAWIKNSISEEDIYEAIVTGKVKERTAKEKEDYIKKYEKSLNESADLIIKVGAKEEDSDKLISLNFVEGENSYESVEVLLMKLNVLGFRIKEDKYFRTLDEEAKLKFKKGLLRVNTRFFRSEEKVRLAYEAIYKVDEEKKPIIEETNSQEIVDVLEECAVDEEGKMNEVPLEEVYEVQKTNAEAFKHLMKSQKDHLNFLEEVFKEYEDSYENKEKTAKALCYLSEKNLDKFKEYIEEQKEFFDSDKRALVSVEDKEGIRAIDVICEKVDVVPRKKDIKKGLAIITADKEGAFLAVADKLKKEGLKIAVLNIEKVDVNACSFPVYTLDKLKDDDIKKVIEKIVNNYKEPLTGFIYMSSKRDKNYIKFEDGFDYNKAIFIIAKYFDIYSEKSSKKDKFFINLVRIDGYLGTKGTSDNQALGGLFGLAKTLYYEWQDTNVKTIDISPECSKEEVSKYVLNEILSGDDRLVELGIDSKGDYHVLMLKDAKMREVEKKVPTKKDVFLVTGGGRGITAKCINRLAEKYNCSFVILGRTKLTGDYPLGTDFDNKRELQNVMIKKMRSDKVKFTPKELSKKVNDYYAQIKIEETLSKLKEAGSRVLYYNCDVTEEEQVENVIKDASKTLGEITGFIHGAGVLADKYIKDKTEDDFNKVTGTKVLGLRSCLNNLQADKIKFMVFFSSVAAFFGNKGQADYAIGNEVLNKTAYKIKKDYPSCKIVSVNWGPWDGGMLNESLKNAFSDRNVSIIPIETGIDIFMEMFEFKQGKMPQVVVYDKAVLGDE